MLKAKLKSTLGGANNVDWIPHLVYNLNTMYKKETITTEDIEKELQSICTYAIEVKVREILASDNTRNYVKNLIEEKYDNLLHLSTPKLSPMLTLVANLFSPIIFTISGTAIIW